MKLLFPPLRTSRAILILLISATISGCASFYPAPEPAPWRYNDLTKDNCPTIQGNYRLGDWSRLIWGTAKLANDRGITENPVLIIDLTGYALNLHKVVASGSDGANTLLSIPLLKNRIFTLSPKPRETGMNHEIDPSQKMPSRRIEEIVGCRDNLLVVHTLQYDVNGPAYNIVRSYETIVEQTDNGDLHVTKLRKVAGKTKTGGTIYGVPGKYSLYGMPGNAEYEMHNIPDQVGIDEFVIKLE